MKSCRFLAFSIGGLLLIASVSSCSTVESMPPDFRAANAVRNGDPARGETIASLEISKNNSRDPKIYLIRAEARFRMNHLDAAESDCLEARKLQAESAAAAVVMARIKLAKHDPAAALAEAKEAVRLAPSDPVATGLLSSVQQYSDRCVSSQENFLRAIQSASSPTEKSFLMAQLAKLRFYNMNLQKEAVSSLVEAHRDFPDSSEISDALAWFRLMARDPSLRNPRQALELARAAVKAAPRNPVYADTLAAAEAANGNFREAEHRQKMTAALLAMTGGSVFFRNQAALKRESDARLALYRADRPYLEPCYAIRVLWMLSAQAAGR